MCFVSIHTPTQGVTDFASISTYVASVSIHTPTQGVTNSKMRTFFAQVVSIHTPTQGVTLDKSKVKNSNEFQSTHPRRV